MSILLALSAAVAAQGVSYQAPPLHTPVREVRVVRVRDQGVLLTHPEVDTGAPRRFVIRRGGFVPGYWAHPGFVIRRPDAYGLRQPFAGGRWIRYHDDALLVDRYGRVHDGRYGYDWSRSRDRWGHDARGIPIYVGDGDYYPYNRDYAWAERFERGDRGELAYDRDYPYDFRYGGEGVASDSGYGDGGYTVVETVITEPATYREVTTTETVGSRPVRRAARTKLVRR